MKKVDKGKWAMIVSMVFVLLIVSLSGCIPGPPATFIVRMRFHVKDDSDPWIRGDGDWVFEMVATTVPLYSGRYPSSGEMTAEECHTYDVTLATITSTITVFSVTITVMEMDDIHPIDTDMLGTRTFSYTGTDLTQTWNTGYFDSTVYITKAGSIL